MSRRSEISRFFRLVQGELKHQRKRWGDPAETDYPRQSAYTWIAYILRYAVKWPGGKREEQEGTPGYFGCSDFSLFRRAMLKVATLALQAYLWSFWKEAEEEDGGEADEF